MRSFLVVILNRLEKLPLPIRWSLLLLTLLLLGLIDYSTGFEFAFTLFYIFPIGLTAWSVGKKMGYLASALSGLVWFVANVLAGQTYSNRIIPYWDILSRIASFSIISYLLAELRLALDTERTLARTDALTGLLNRRAFYQGIQYELERLKRYQIPLTLVYIDLDNFKTINDQYGHETGDLVLTRVARGLTRNLRTLDSVARLGGDEFAILLPQTNDLAIKVILPRLRWHLLAEMEQYGWNVTFSIGALTCRQTFIRMDELIQHADQLMYEVKHTSKDGIAFRVV